MDTTISHNAYSSDVSDEKTRFVAPDPTLMLEGSAQRDHDLREVFNGPRWIIRTRSPCME